MNYLKSENSHATGQVKTLLDSHSRKAQIAQRITHAFLSREWELNYSVIP